MAPQHSCVTLGLSCAHGVSGTPHREVGNNVFSTLSHQNQHHSKDVCSIFFPNHEDMFVNFGPVHCKMVPKFNTM